MKIALGIATTQERYEYARKAVNSLKGQADFIHLHVNSEQYDIADNGKFKGLQILYKQNDLPDYYLTVDDDLIYPRNYVKNVVKAIEQFNTIVTYHGRKLTGTNRDYYKGHVYFSCLQEVDDNVRVDVPGTGCTGFRVRDFNPYYLADDPQLYMSDLLFAREAAKQQKKITILKHPKTYFKYQDIPKDLTIYERFKDNCEAQNKLADEIYNLNYPK